MTRTEIEAAVSATARLSLWLADELEPLSMRVAEEDLDLLYDLCIAVERQGRATFGEKWTLSHD